MPEAEVELLDSLTVTNSDRTWWKSIDRVNLQPPKELSVKEAARKATELEVREPSQVKTPRQVQERECVSSNPNGNKTNAPLAINTD